MLGNACGLRDFTRGGAAVVPMGEKGSGGVEQKSTRRATGPPSRRGRHFCRVLLRDGRSLGHGFRIVCTILNVEHLSKEGAEVGAVIMLGTLFGLIALIFGAVQHFDPEARRASSEERDS